MSQSVEIFHSRLIYFTEPEGSENKAVRVKYLAISL